MIAVLLEFYDKDTKRIADEIKVNLPEDIVFRAAESDAFTGDEFSMATAENKQIDYINCRPFAVTDEIKTYVTSNHSELKNKFSSYDCFFIGRHGLGAEYD